jgi:transposase
LYGHLTDAGFNAVCVETNHAQRFLSTRPVKTDKNDARGLAEMMRIGHYRAVHVKTFEAQMVRTVLQARRQLVTALLQLQGTIRGLLRMHGLKMGTTHHRKFSDRVRELLAEKPALQVAIDPLLRSVEQLAFERKEIDKRLEQAARRDDVCLRLMTIPGVGSITSLAYRATIDDPTRITSSKAVGALFGLTPRIYQSGEIDRSGKISRAGDDMMRHLLYEAASALMTRIRKQSSLRSWGMAIARRRGFKRANVAVARKLAVIMHRIWISGSRFEPGMKVTIPAA